MDYNDNQESTGLISNQALNRGQVVIGTRDVITANDVINNRPIEFNATRTMDQFFNCDNKQSDLSQNNGLAMEGDTNTVLSFNRTHQDGFSPEAATNGRSSWQELSPKKEKKCYSGDSSGSGSASGSFSTASSSSRSSPSKSWKGSLEKGANKNQIMTWRDVSPTKAERRPLGSTSPQSPIRSPERPLSRQQLQQQPHSPEHGCARRRGPAQGLYNYNEVYKLQSSPEHGPETFPPASPSLGNQVDDQINNDYFYDEDFTVQFDTNLRESSPGLNCTCVDPSLMIGFPHTVTGSYLNFNNTKGTNFINQNSTELFCPDESELSYSRNSAMDVSTSEREMMCSSDMLDFSDNPLFTPSPTHDVQTTTANTLTNENVMTDSLDKVTKDHLRLGHNMELSSSQTSSSDLNFCVNCCPRKDEYFLSFVGSQGSKGSASDNENSVTSVDSGQGHWNNQQNTANHGSACSTEDGGEESSDSFHFSYSGNGSGGKNKTSIASKGQRFNALGALQETSMEHSISSEDSVTFDRPSNGRRDLRLHCSAHAHTFPRNQCGNTPSKLPLMTSPKKKAHHFFINNGNLSSKSNTSNSRHRSKKVTSWRQVKSLRKLGRLENVLDPSRSTSMPDLQQNWQSLSSYDLQKIAESFHSKRHSAYLLDLYQRVKNQSNPVSPETMANIEHILFQPNFTNHGHNTQVDHGSLQKAHTDTDTYSDHTLTNSHAHFTSSTQQPMEYSTRKRILEWLEKEKFEGTNRAKGSQTEVTRSTKETIVSPTTVTLWCGTRNFGSQFPPSMKDCAIQTSVEETPRRQKVCCHDMGQQTSPMSDRSQLLSLLPEKFNELEEIFPIKQEIIEETDLKSKLILPRSKSADSARTKKPVNVENTSKSTFYSHKSLPDLSFLKATPLTPDSDNFSLFDPLPNDTPLPVYVQTEEYAHAQETIRNKVASHSHHARKEAEPHSGANYKRSRSAPPRTVNPNIPRNCAESGSSSSGFSTSSTSSGIDPGYSEPRSYHNGSPSNDIERLLFYPPHVESTAKKCDVCKSEPSDPGISEMTPVAANNQQIVPVNVQSVPISVQQQLVMTNIQDITKIPLVRHSPDKRINRYTNEVHPGVIDVRHRARTPPIKCPTNNSGLGSAGNSTNSSQTFLEHLYALQEENTPISSPERSASPYGFHYDINGIPCYRGESCTCCLTTIDLDAESLQEWHRDQLILRRRLDCQIQLSSESGSSSSSSLIPNIDKKPLKSCLRKKQVIRSRSLSEPYGLLQQIEGQRKQHTKKVNRHSYACEEVYLLRDETGEYYLCENKDETEEEEMEDEDVDDDKDDDDKDREVGMFYLEDDSNTQTVRRRQKKDKKPPVEEKKDNADDSSDKELSGKRKSVSFASEVSFHAISPQDSPKRRDRQPDDDDEEEEDEKKEEPKAVVVTPVTEGKIQVSIESVPKPVSTQSSVTSIGSCDSDGAPPTEFLLSPPTETPESYPTGPEVDRRRVLLQDVSGAAEALVKHFAKAKNPFDKLRLGSSADTPEIGELVVSTLCPAVNKVVSDGLKTYLAGVQVFGRVQVTVWKLTEASAEQGPYTRAIYELVQQLKTHSGLTTHNHKFDAFILGLLNLRLLDYWVGYLRHSDCIMEKYYNQEAVIILGKTVHQREFDEMLTALQELAVLPFQLNFDLVVEKCPKTKNSPIHSPTRLSPIGSPTSSKSLTKDDKGSPPAKPPRRASTGITTGLTTTAWNWLKGGATEPAEPAVDSNHGNSMISSLTSMLGNWRGRDYNKGDVPTKEATPICQSSDQPSETEQHKNVDKVSPKHLSHGTAVEVDVGKNVSQKNLNMPENTDATNKSISPKSSPVKKDVVNVTKPPAVSDRETSTSHKETKDDSEKMMSQSQEKSMIDSVTGITQKLLGIAPNAKEKAAYKKGVTDYDFNTEKAEEKAKKERSPENSISRIPVPSSRSTHHKIDTSGSKDKTPENSVTEKHDSKQQASTTSAASSCSSSQEERPKNLKLRRPPTTNTAKSKSGLIKLFDKLLLPKDSPSSSQKSQAQKPKNRWSWGAGHNASGVSETAKPGAGARPKSVCIPKQESNAPPRHVCHSAIPAPTKKKSTTASAKDNNKEVSKNVKASPAKSIDPQRKLGGQENDQVKIKMSQSGDPKGDNSKPSILNKDDPKRDQSLLVQLDKSGEAKLQQTFHVDDKGEANLRQRVELDKSGQSRDQKITVQLDKSTQVKLQQTVELNQTGEAKLHQTVEVDDENKNKKDSSKTEMKPIRSSWKAVERGPTLILPTTCKFLDNIEERKKNNDPESPKRRKNESPKRSPSSRPSPANSPKSPRSKSGKRWSLYNPGSKKDELVDLDINSNSAEPSQHAKSAPTTPVKTKATKIDQSPSRKAGSKGDGTKNKKIEKKLDNAAKKKDTAEKEEEKRDSGAEKRKEPECFFYKPKYRYIKTVKKFESTDPGYLSFEEGEYFEVLAQVDAVRLFCVNGKKEGLIQIEAVKSMTDRDEFDTLHDNFYH